MEIFIKLAPGAYKRLRNQVPADSAAHEAIENADQIDYSVEGVLFAGYTITCNEHQARILLTTATQSCPDIVPNIEQAIKFARSE
jgi:hypothetical protein